MTAFLVCVLVLPGLCIGLGCALARGSYAEFEKAQRKAKAPPRKTALQRKLEASGRRVQVIDLDTGEVYEPKEKV